MLSALVTSFNIQRQKTPHCGYSGSVQSYSVLKLTKVFIWLTFHFTNDKAWFGSTWVHIVI